MSTTAPQIQQLVQQALGRLEQLAASDDPPTQVLGKIIETLAQAAAAPGGAVWMPTEPGAGAGAGQFRCVARIGQGALAMQQDQAPLPAAAPIIAQAHDQRKPIAVAPDSPEFQSTELRHATQFLVPIDAMGKSYGVMHLIAPTQLDPKVYRQYVAFIQQGARAAGMYLARRQSQVVSEDAASHAHLLHATHKLLAVEKPRDLIHELATIGRGLLEAQRVSVIGFWRRRGDVAFSDTIDVNRRGVLVRAVEMLAELVKHRQAPMTFVKGSPLSDEDAAVEPLLEQLYGLGAAAAVCLTPIRHGEKIIAVMVGEYGDSTTASRRAASQQELSRQAAPILGHAVAAHQRPLRRTSSAIAWVRRRPIMALARAILVLGLIAGAGYALFFLPVDIIVRGDARLEPARLAQVTAPLDGRVKNVLVKTGDAVTAGQVLLELDDSDLKLQLSSIEKRLDEEELAWSTASEKSKKGDPAATAAKDAAQFRIASLQIERRRLIQKIDDALVRAPIDGVMLTENPDERMHMTVTKGTVLLVVADLSRFDLVAELKEEDLALVDRALSEGRSVPAAFLSRAWPDHPQHAVIEDPQSLAPTSAPDEYEQQHVFRVVTPIELEGITEQLALANPTGRVKLTTGQGSIAYRYGRGLWRFVQMTLLF